MKADLHLHTTASDGALTPSQVVQWAKNKGLEVIAITDHDSVDGLDEGREMAKKLGIKFVDGIELSTFSICEIHILGYNFDYKNPDFVQELQKAKDCRRERNLRIGANLEALGIHTNLDFGADGLGRMNMAREIVRCGYCPDIQTVFEKYLGVHGKAYCEVKRMTPVQAVQLIKKYGGVASLAHPKRYLLDNRLDMLLGGLKKFGLDAIELNYPSHTDADKASFLAYAKKYHLLTTGGSDYHGEEDKNFMFNISTATAVALKVDK